MLWSHHRLVVMPWMNTSIIVDIVNEGQLTVLEMIGCDEMLYRVCHDTYVFCLILSYLLLNIYSNVIFHRSHQTFWIYVIRWAKLTWRWYTCYCPACRTTLVATRFRVAVICPIIQVPHFIRVFFYFVWFVFINHIFQFYYEWCTYCNILDVYLS